MGFIKGLGSYADYGRSWRHKGLKGGVKGIGETSLTRTSEALVPED